MKKIPINEFQSRCLALLEDVVNSQETLIITLHEQPVARIVPFVSKPKETENPLKDSIIFEDDIVTPLDIPWEAAQ
jgi:antitoxin (DNA-binding transcriptional repressor) of toxin-antitoxin stability system